MRTIKDPSERKRELVAAATELFINNSYEKTTVENIINKVGVAKGCFYHYFRSKEEIFEECIANITETIIRTYLNIFTDENKNSKQKLLEYIDYNYQLVEQEHSSSIFESIHSETFAKMHERIMKDSVKQIMPAFIHLIEQGKHDGVFHIVNAEFTAASLLGAFQEIHALLSHNQAIARKDQRALIIDLMERILQTKF